MERMNERKRNRERETGYWLFEYSDWASNIPDENGLLLWKVENPISKRIGEIIDPFEYFERGNDEQKKSIYVIFAR